MNLEDFSFDLPTELIAQNPVTPRDQARLLVYNRKTKAISHHKVADLPNLLAPETVLVANNSKVRKARLFATTTNNRRTEVVILEPKEGSCYRCLTRGKLSQGDTLRFCNEQGHDLLLTATVTGKEEGPGMTTTLLTFSISSAKLEKLLEKEGSVPLPPYITHSSSSRDQYQTVYAEKLGSAAAPTAGLHFTPELIQKLKAQHFLWQEVTLHVGLGTFLPLRESEVAKNQLHSEETEITPRVIHVLTTARQQGKTILAIGTTSIRTLESHSTADKIRSGSLRTNLFIYPGYRFQTATALLTNFHLPHSSLLLLVAAFLGNDPQKGVVLTPEEMTEQLQKLYRLAITERYRFFSFGDAMLIL